MKSISLTIRAKITLLAVVAILFLAGVGAVAVEGIYSLSKIANEAIESDNTMFKLAESMNNAHDAFKNQVHEWKNLLIRGNSQELYNKHHDAFEKLNADVDKNLELVRKYVKETEKHTHVDPKFVDDLLKEHKALHEQYLEALKRFNPAVLTSGQEVDRQIVGVDKTFNEMMIKADTVIADAVAKEAANSKSEVEAKSKFVFALSAGLLALALLFLMGLGYFIVRGIISSFARLMGTIAKINEGDTDARAEVVGSDEVAVMAKEFNDLLDARMLVQAKIEAENEQLNDSVLNLLRAVAMLAQKDLTAKVPVSADVTGAVSDALNLFSQETSKVLQEVSNISADVTMASIKVQRQAEALLLTAAEERAEVGLTEQSLSSAASALDEIAELARGCNVAADNAVKNTQMALSTVINTVNGINTTRDVIRETEKRIKRLGERSQEISGVVSLINVIAERTHILALNASMHAASAGEAGRGFAVVADEVQRLAENARQATQQIAALVSNIQLETVDTVNTMNIAITQIVEGTRLAEQAGQQMQLTGDATTNLAESVKQIAATSAVQARAGQELLERAASIKRSSEHTSRELQEQSNQTNNLVEYARQLLATVRVFKLPG